MRKFIIIAIIAAGYMYIGSGQDQFEGARYSVAGSRYNAETHGKVVMYSTTWCGVCQMTREFFDAENIDYIEYDIEESEEHYRQFSELGGYGVPLIKIGRDTISGYDPNLILATIGPR